jgi:hypothetical protein
MSNLDYFMPDLVKSLANDVAKLNLD